MTTRCSRAYDLLRDHHRWWLFQSLRRRYDILEPCTVCLGVQFRYPPYCIIYLNASSSRVNSYTTWPWWSCFLTEWEKWRPIYIRYEWALLPPTTICLGKLFGIVPILTENHLHGWLSVHLLQLIVSRCSSSCSLQLLLQSPWVLHVGLVGPDLNKKNRWGKPDKRQIWLIM